MTSYKIYLKKHGSTGSMDKLWDVVKVEAQNEQDLKNQLNQFSKKGWKVFKVDEFKE